MLRQIEEDTFDETQDKVKFDCERFILLTDLENAKLKQLKKLRNIKWHTNVGQILKGQYIGEELLENKGLRRYAKTYITVEPTSFMIID